MVFTHKHPIYSLSLFVFSLLLLVIGFTSQTVFAAGESYSWKNDGSILASGGAYSVPVTISLRSDKTWGISTNGTLNFSGTKCQVGPTSGYTPLFTVSTSNDTISFNGKVTGQNTSCPIQKLGTSTHSISGKTSTTKPPSSTPTTCGDYATNKQQSACNQGSGYGKNGVDSGNKSCAAQTWDTDAQNSKDALVAACKFGVQLGNTQSMTSLFATVRAAACADESGGTAATCQSTFDNHLATCVKSANGDLAGIKTCLKKVYPNLASQIDAAGTDSSDKDNTCGDIVTAIGWIVCPVLNAVGGLDDGMWNLIVGPLLTVSPLTQSPDLQHAWGALRNIANVVLVVVFLIIIFSQLTGAGITNYGVKKMLPRIVVAAILINVSFVIIELAVDLSNIIGNSLYGLMAHLTSETPKWSGLIALVIALGAAGATAAAAVAIAPEAVLLFILPAALAAALGFLAAIATLILRQAAIPVLAIAAPLAFAAYILPNTRSWYDKWQKWFISMLMLYPIAALLFGGVQVAASAITNQDQWWSLLVALLVLSVPLFSLPFIARQTGPMLSKINGKMQGWAQKGGNAAGKAVKPYRDNAYNRALGSKARPGILGAPRRLAQRFDRGRRNIEQDVKNSGKALDNQWEDTEGAQKRLMEAKTLAHESTVSQNKLDAVYLKTTAGKLATSAVAKSQLEKQMEENLNNEHIEATMPVDLKLKAKLSEETLQTERGRTDQLYKEAAAVGNRLDVSHGVNPILSGTIEQSHRAGQVVANATQAAERVQQRAMTEAFRTNADGIATAAAGIDAASGGETRVIANAIAARQRARDEGVSAASTLLESKGTSFDDYQSIAADSSRTIEERLAATQAVGKLGVPTDLAKLHDTLTSNLVAAKASGDAKAEEDALALQQIYSSSVVGNSKRPKTMGGGTIGKFSEGVQKESYADMVKGTLNTTGVSARDFSSMDWRETKQIVTLLDTDPSFKSGLATSGKKTSLKANVDAALDDPLLNTSLSPEQFQQLKDLQARLT